MIGDKIRNVLDAWREAIISGDAIIPYEVFEAGCVELRDAARMADAVERRRVPTHLRVVGSDDATAPVVDLLAFRKRIPARPKYLPHGGPKGGSAA